MAFHRLGQARLFYEFDEADLRGDVSVASLRFVLRDYAGTGLQDGCGMNVSAIVEQLRHADFFAEDSGYSFHFFSRLLPLGYPPDPSRLKPLRMTPQGSVSSLP